MKKIIKTKVEMSVADYVKEHEGINRHDVYKMIKDGELKAHKGYKGKWIIELEKEVEETPKKPSKEASKKVKEYTVKEFVEAYNKKHPKAIVTVPEVRKLLADDILSGKKVNRKWVVTATPSRRIK